MNNQLRRQVGISCIEVKSFKCFERLRLPVAPLTLLTGYNGAGKSSFLQPLLLASQALRSSRTPDEVALNGRFVKLGTVGEVIPLNSETSTKFNFYGINSEIEWLLSGRTGERSLSVASRSSSGDHVPELGRAIAQLSFISGVRRSARDGFPMPDGHKREPANVGVDGKFASYWYDQLADDEVLPERRHVDEPAGSFRKQVDAWLATLFPGAQANVQLAQPLSRFSLDFRMSDIGAWCKPANVGYGLSYSFPILVSLLAASSQQILVVDSPEAHLHPFAQSQMGRMLAVFAAAGVQIIVETHSDHLLNGIRLAIKERILDASAFQVHFFSGVKTGSHGVVSPRVNSEGQLDDWPRGFFDQGEHDLVQLTAW